MANAKDLEDIPPVFKEKINFILAENLDEVFAVAFEKNEKFTNKKSGGKKQKVKTPSAAA
jgi:ATP-dependent Lon protease